jgi:AcrR family transcriptional regulator
MTPRGERRRAEIVQAALELFADRGYHDSGVADIAAQLRMSHGTFYRYFESKRDILEHLVDYGSARIQAVIAVDGVATDSPATIAEYRAQVAAIAGALVGLVYNEPQMIRVLLFEATGVDAEMTAKVFALLDALRAVTAAYLQRGIEAGFLANDLDAEETARAINGMVFAGALSSLRENGAAGPQAPRYLEAALRLMFDGVSDTDDGLASSRP